MNQMMSVYTLKFTLQQSDSGSSSNCSSSNRAVVVVIEVVFTCSRAGGPGRRSGRTFVQSAAVVL